MSISGVAKLSETLGGLVSQAAKPDHPGSQVSFKETLEAVGGNQKVDAVMGGTLQRDIQMLQADLLTGRKLSASELLLYQIKVGQFGLRVELLSKVAEGLLGTVRKFQQGQ